MVASGEDFLNVREYADNNNTIPLGMGVGEGGEGLSRYCCRSQTPRDQHPSGETEAQQNAGNLKYLPHTFPSHLSKIVATPNENSKTFQPGTFPRNPQLPITGCLLPPRPQVTKHSTPGNLICLYSESNFKTPCLPHDGVQVGTSDSGGLDPNSS